MMLWLVSGMVFMLFTGCASFGGGVDTIAFPRAELAYHYGILTARLGDLCIAKKLDDATCKEIGVAEKYLKRALFDRAQKTADTDQLMQLLGMAAKFAL